MAHFMAHDIRVETVRIQHQVGGAPGRTQTAARAFAAVAVFLVFFGITAQNKRGLSDGFAPKSRDALSAFVHGRVHALPLHRIYLRTHVQSFVYFFETGKSNRLAVEDVGIKEVVTPDDQENSR